MSLGFSEVVIAGFSKKKKGQGSKAMWGLLALRKVSIVPASAGARGLARNGGDCYRP